MNVFYESLIHNVEVEELSIRSNNLIPNMDPVVQRLQLWLS